MPTAGGGAGSTNFEVKVHGCVPKVFGPLDGSATGSVRLRRQIRDGKLPSATASTRSGLGGGVAGGDSHAEVFAGAGLPNAELLLPIVRARQAQERLRAQAGPLRAQADPLRIGELEGAELGRGQRPPGSDINHILAVYGMHFSGGESPVQASEPVPGLQRLGRLVVQSARFEAAFAALVVLNVAITALEIDHQDEAPEFFKVSNSVFAVAFTLEVVVRVLADPNVVRDALLIFDFFIVTVTIFEVVLLEIVLNQDSSGEFGEAFDFSYLLALRLFRLIRVVRIGKFLGSLEVLCTLTDAASNVVEPLFFVILLLFILIFALSLMLTSLVPLAAEGEEVVRRVVSEHYGSLGGSMLSLLEATAGVAEWGPDVMRPLLHQVSEQGAGWPAAFLAAMLLAVAALHLGVAGLVTGIFLDQICAASQRREELDWQAELQDHHGLLGELDWLFSSIGYVSREAVSWVDLSRALEANVDVLEKLDISMEVMEALFYHLDQDGDGAVTTDTFIFGIFKLRTISKSIDMLSIDYQQEKAIHRITELRATLRASSSDAHEKLLHSHNAVLRISEEIDDLRAGLREVRAADATLSAQRKAFELRCLGTRSEGDRQHINVEALRADYALHYQVEELEESAARLSARGSPKCAARTLPLPLSAAGAATVDMVLGSVREMICDELSEAAAVGLGAAGSTPAADEVSAAVPTFH